MTDTQIANTILGQIGVQNILAISGGRKLPLIKDKECVGVVLPVRYGYSVEVELDRGSDTYTVRRVFRRGMKRWVKKEIEHVYCDNLGDVAYEASLYMED